MKLSFDCSSKDTLEYAFDIYANAENLQYQKNLTNQIAKATVNFRGTDILTDLPVDDKQKVKGTE